MIARDLMRALTPLGWLVTGLAVVLVIAVAGRGLGFRWDPFNQSSRRLQAAEQRADAASRDAAARNLEATAGVDQARRLDTHNQRALEVTRATATAQAEARSAHDADKPLDPDRIARLRDHDRELCRSAPDLCRAATIALAASRDRTLQAGSLAGERDGR